MEVASQLRLFLFNSSKSCGQKRLFQFSMLATYLLSGLSRNGPRMGVLCCRKKQLVFFCGFLIME